MHASTSHHNSGGAVPRTLRCLDPKANLGILHLDYAQQVLTPHQSPVSSL
jgi:hypothetical protein